MCVCVCGLRAGGVGGPLISPWAGLWAPVCVGSGQVWGATLPLAGVGEVLENVPRWPFILSCASRLSGRCPEARGDKETPAGGGPGHSFLWPFFAQA